jgi:hypothetical protein
MVEYIYYDGIGAKKSGKHTVNDFLDIMNKTAKVECLDYLADLNYSACSEYKKMHKKAPLISFDSKSGKLIYKFNSKSDNKKYKSLSNKCTKYKKTMKNKRCTLDEYIGFSGALRSKDAKKNKSIKSIKGKNVCLNLNELLPDVNMPRGKKFACYKRSNLLNKSVKVSKRKSK